VIALAHKGGCGMAADGPDHHLLNRVLGGFARHANVGAYLFVGLGCEDAQITHLTAHEAVPLSRRGPVSGLGPVPSLVIQDRGGIRKTVDAGVAALREILPDADRARREEVPASALVFGTNCGGSDAFSGITANPAVGAAADLVVAQGGSVILGETPEIYGAEHLLTRRAASREVGEALIERIRWWEWYTATFDATLNNNPSPGNKAGGLTTIAEKSLGAIAKGGTTTLRSVVGYAEPVTTPGLTVMDTPGFDPVSMTGIVAGGANVAAFTTGRGSVYGCKPVPCLKVASNSVMFHRMIDDMDVNAGEILSGTPVQELGRAIFEELLAVASGKETKSEALGLGEDEFAPWVIGPVL
jgi:altronate hydrolase